MKRLSLFILLSIIILILLYNLLISSSGYKERENLMNENDELSVKNKHLIDSNEELRFEIINAQDSEEHIENYARENLNLSMPDEKFIKFNEKDTNEENEE
ncbi:septum formation initiator family protein [Gammaproteobacteria bacterium]|nr:septum formation initiator family protein [Gammaproteobacteria bacterium]